MRLMQVLWSQVNYRSNGAVKYITSATLQGSPEEAAASPGGFCWDLGKVQAVAVSPSGKWTLVVRPSADEKKKSSVLQVWGRGRLCHEIDLDALVIADAYFAGFQWDADESRICFVAEQMKESGPEMGEQAGGGTWRGQAPYDPHWGELLVGLRQPSVYVLDISSSPKVDRLDTPADMACGHCTWTPDGQAVVYTAWPPEQAELPAVKRPGLIYCYNRPTALFASKVGPGHEPLRLTPESLRSASNPCFSPDGKELVFVSHAAAVAAGTHGATSQLLSMPWAGLPSQQAAEPRTVVPVMQRPRKGDGFPGLYVDRVSPRHWWSGGGKTWLLVDTVWGTDDAIVAVETQSGELRRLSPPGDSYRLMSVDKDLAVATASNMVSPPQVAIASLPACLEAEPQQAAWRVADTGREPSSKVLEVLAKVESHTLSYQPEGATDPVEALVVKPRSSAAAAPPVLWFHGGPHSAHTSSWAKWATAVFASELGRCIIMPNYRGSVGYGEDALQSLPGNVGSQDVSDNMAAVRAAQAQGLCAAPEAAGLYCVGGSHGGFLTCHTAGQYSNLVRAAVAVNPVCDISSFATTTDIPDWCFVEALGKLTTFSAAPSIEDLAAMRACSPAAHAAKAAAVPHLFLLGAKDLRVNKEQGLNQARLLKEQGGKTVLTYMFPEDSHPLERPRTTLQYLLLALQFLEKYQ